MCSDYQTCSLHYVNSYAVKDRIDFSQFSSETPTELTLFEVLPNDAYKSLKDDFTVLVSRMIVEHMAFFSADYKGYQQSTFLIRFLKKWLVRVKW